MLQTTSDSKIIDALPDIPVYKVVEEYDFMSLEVSYMKRLETVDREAGE